MKCILLISMLALSGCATATKLIDPAAITMRADSSWQVSGKYYYTNQGAPYNGAIGRVSLTMEVPISTTLLLNYGIEHKSYVETFDDRGEERAIIGFTWKPFCK